MCIIALVEIEYALCEYEYVLCRSHPVKAAVPYAEPDRVYDVRYYPRDTRRAELPGGSKKVEVKEWKVGEEREKKEQARGAAAGTPHRWGQFRSILDHDNNGYTV